MVRQGGGGGGGVGPSNACTPCPSPEISDEDLIFNLSLEDSEPRKSVFRIFTVMRPDQLITRIMKAPQLFSEQMTVTLQNNFPGGWGVELVVYCETSNACDAVKAVLGEAGYSCTQIE
jgi:hypothetical protein